MCVLCPWCVLKPLPRPAPPPQEQRLTQLQTQVKDLERYVSFLRANSAPGPRRTPPPHHAYSDSSPSPPQLSDSDSAPRFRHILGPQAPLPPLTQLGGVRCAVDVSIAESRKEAALHEQTPSQASSSLVSSLVRHPQPYEDC